MKFIPHDYQEYAVRFITEHKEALMMLDMGLGLQDRNFSTGHYGADV